MKKKILFAWSSGKDSALALYELRKNKDYEILALLTTVTEGYGRVSMHGVRVALLEKQAENLGLPLEIVYISQNSSNEEYDARMKEKLLAYQSKGVEAVAFGDIFLEELKKYREEKLAQVGMSGIFPLWQRDTKALAHEFISLGFKAVLTCVDSKHLDGKFASRDFTEQFLAELPANVDPCGENGEFHSFAYAGPIFRDGVQFQKGEVVLRDNRFYFGDLLPIE